MVNYNVAWINERGTWGFYVIALAVMRYSLFVLGMRSDVGWTLLLVGHSIITVSFLDCASFCVGAVACSGPVNTAAHSVEFHWCMFKKVQCGLRATNMTTSTSENSHFPRSFPLEL